MNSSFIYSDDELKEKKNENKKKKKIINTRFLNKKNTN